MDVCVRAQGIQNGSTIGSPSSGAWCWPDAVMFRPESTVLWGDGLTGNVVELIKIKRG